MVFIGDFVVLFKDYQGKSQGGKRQESRWKEVKVFLFFVVIAAIMILDSTPDRDPPGPIPFQFGLPI